MKYLKIALVIFSIGLLVQIYMYVNLSISYKYEVDLMETNINTEKDISSEVRSNQLHHLEQRKKEILHQQDINEILFWMFLVLLTVCLLIFKKYYVRKDIQ